MGVVLPGFKAKSFDNQLVVVALRKPRNSHRADDACVLNVNRKAASVGCIIRKRQTVFFQQIGFFLPQVQADCIRTAKEMGDDIALPPHPIQIGWGGAFQCGVKKRISEVTDIERYGKLALQRQITKGRANAPRNVIVEMWKNKRLFLPRQSRKIVVDGQLHNPLLNAAKA